jgi:hypothetical protein
VRGRTLRVGDTAQGGSCGETEGDRSWGNPSGKGKLCERESVQAGGGNYVRGTVHKGASCVRGRGTLHKGISCMMGRGTLHKGISCVRGRGTLHKGVSCVRGRGTTQGGKLREGEGDTAQGGKLCEGEGDTAQGGKLREGEGDTAQGWKLREEEARVHESIVHISLEPQTSEICVPSANTGSSDTHVSNHLPLQGNPRTCTYFGH